MKRNLALLGIMLLLPLSSFAQYSLLGQVTDETGTSIQGAQLCLYQDGELAGLAQSNAKGEYRIGDVPRGSYQVVASCVGYSSDEDSVVIDRDANLNFILMTKSVELDSVVVMGSSSRATSKGHVFYLTKKAKECGNPFVALQEIPLLYSDPCKRKCAFCRRSVDTDTCRWHAGELWREPHRPRPHQVGGNH